MGLLAVGTPLDWPQTKLVADRVRAWGIEQLLAIWHAAKDKENDALLWGDEIEYLVVAHDDEHAKVRLSLRQADILAALARDVDVDAPGPGVAAVRPAPIFHPEFGRFMLEATPGKPWGIGFKDLLDVEPNMRWRRALAKAHMAANEHAVTLTTFPRLGCPDSTTPSFPVAGDKLRSQFVPDEIANPHIRFPTLAANIRVRRGRKVAINVPVFRDARTPWPFRDPTVDYGRDQWPEDGDVRRGAAKDGHIYMDAMAFGMGSCCLQITFQAKNVAEGRTMYDQLSPLGPVLLALTAATPMYKGFLADTDVRWNQVGASVDDRTPKELGEVNKHGGEHGCGRRLPKSRYASNSTYIAQDARLRPEYDDADLVVDAGVQARLQAGGMDARLAKHFAHLFIRDPLVVFAEDVARLDLGAADHFENLQSTNWQHMRFKPPPPASDETGWRVEFRAMEVQPTDEENAAFAIFVVLVTRAILSFRLNLYLPIARVAANMDAAHARDAVRDQRFFFRTDPFSDGVTGPVDAEYALLSVRDIVNGPSSLSPATAAAASGPVFPGLVPLVESYLDSVNVDVATRCALARYLDVVRRRAAGVDDTPARWMRAFVRNHPAYHHDSVVSDAVVWDLVRAVERRADGADTAS